MSGLAGRPGRPGWPSATLGGGGPIIGGTIRRVTQPADFILIAEIMNNGLNHTDWLGKVGCQAYTYVPGFVTVVLWVINT